MEDVSLVMMVSAFCLKTLQERFARLKQVVLMLRLLLLKIVNLPIQDALPMKLNALN